MNNISLGRYVPANTFIHKLDPRVKFVLMIGFLVTVFFDLTSIEYGFLLTSIMAMLLISKVSIKSIFKSLKVMWFMIILLLIINIFVIKTGVKLLEIGNLIIYSGSFVQTFKIFLRIFLIISLTTLLTATTKPLEITYAIEFFLSPLRIIKFPVSEIAMTISIALRFIPTFLDETQKIMKAQESRGVDFVNGSLKEKLNAITSLIIPLFISAFQKSDDLANAMEARGYDTQAPRTRYRIMKFTYKDLISVLVIALIMTLTFISLSNPTLFEGAKLWLSSIE